MTSCNCWTARLPAAVLLLACLPSLCAQGSGVITLVPPGKVTARRGQAVEVKLAAQLRSGYHVNSHAPGDDYLIPLKLSWDAAPLEVTGVVYPKPVVEKYPFAEKPLSVFTGVFAVPAIWFLAYRRRSAGVIGA